MRNIALKTRLTGLTLAGFAAIAMNAQNAQPRTEEEVRQTIMEQSLAKFNDACVCPYSLDKKGKKCGNNSLYMRPSTTSPICYAKDIPDQVVQSYMNAHPIIIKVRDTVPATANEGTAAHSDSE